MTQRVRLRYLLRERDNRGGEGELVLSVYREYGVVPKASRDDNFNKTPQDLSMYKRVGKGDLVVNKMKAWQGSLGVSEHDGVVSGDYLVCRVTSHDVDRRYLHQLLRSAPMIDQYRRRSTGIRPSQWRLYWDDFCDIEVELPPLAEQRAIADYLNAETARIDALIAKKQQLIHLLDERWRAALTLAVAPDGVFSSAGRWPTAAFGAVVQIAEGQVDPRTPPWSDLALVAPNHVESGTGRLIARETAQEQGAISGKYRCRQGDVIYSKIRPALMKAVLAEEDCLCSADMYPLRPSGALRARFLLYLLLSPPFTEVAVLESERVAMPKINRDALGRVRVPLPPPVEQDRIIEHLDRRREEDDRLRSRLKQQLDLLAEHRHALITAAVTGGLDPAGPGAA